MKLSMPLHSSRRHQGDADMDSSTSACDIQQERVLSLHASMAKTNTIYPHTHSSSQMKDIRFPHRVSSSSSSSDEPLAPVPSNFRRWRHPLFATLPHKHCNDDGPLSPPSSTLDQVDERSSSTAASLTASKLCIQKMLSSAKWDSIENHPSNALDSISSKRRRTVDLHCEEAPSVSGDDIDVDKEDKRKLIMWRAACAMAHAYLHQHDPHQQGLHQRNQHKLSFHIPRDSRLVCNVALNDKSMQVNGPLLQEELYNLRQVTEHIKNPLPSSSSPPTTSKDGANTTSMCLVSDVICIDEVVNPTQAAEWFGVLFSSSSTLVS